MVVPDQQPDKLSTVPGRQEGLTLEHGLGLSVGNPDDGLGSEDRGRGLEDPPAIAVRVLVDSLGAEQVFQAQGGLETEEIGAVSGRPVPRAMSPRGLIGDAEAFLDGTEPLTQPFLLEKDLGRCRCQSTDHADGNRLGPVGVGVGKHKLKSAARQRLHGHALFRGEPQRPLSFDRGRRRHGHQRLARLGLARRRELPTRIGLGVVEAERNAELFAEDDRERLDLSDP